MVIVRGKLLCVIKKEYCCCCAYRKELDLAKWMALDIVIKIPIAAIFTKNAPVVEIWGVVLARKIGRHNYFVCRLNYLPLFQ